MKRLLLISVLLLTFMLSACNLPAVTSTPLPTLAVVPSKPPATFVVPSATATPTATPLPTATGTPTIPIAWPKDQPVNCRYGPGLKWEAVSGLLEGVTAEIVGKNTELAWWYIRDPLHEGELCWVAMSVIETAGNTANVPIIEPPKALVTKVTADAKVTFTACGGPNPVEFSGSISTNGPATVTYRWEVSGDTTVPGTDETIEFTESGTKTLTAPAFSIDCGEYTVTLRVSQPNETFGEKKFKIQAP
ncbi:MAG: hypothetical protein Kow002_13120 [Anaerolineales bacterium]